MNIHIEDGVITVTFPMIEIVITVALLYVIVVLGVYTAIKLARGMV
jgi:hypothetical protein